MSFIKRKSQGGGSEGSIMRKTGEMALRERAIIYNTE